MDCQEIKNIASDYVNHRLPDDLVTIVEEHLCICEGCRSYLSTILNKEEIVSEESNREGALENNRDSKSQPRNYQFISYFILGTAFILVLFLIYLFLKSQHLVITW